MITPPAVTSRIIEASLEEWLPRAKGRRLVLVYGRYPEGVAEFLMTRPVRRRVHVTDQHSVLGIVEAWQQHEAEHSADDDVLVVTTSVADDQLGWDVRGYAVGRRTRTIDRARIVAQRFGASDIDPRIRAEPWLVSALLDAEPPGGWSPSGTVLTRDAAVRALIGARLGAATMAEGTFDAGALLEWSREPAGPARFAELAEAERRGLTDWLTGTVGLLAPLLLRLATEGRAADALPLGVVGAAVTDTQTGTGAALAFGGLLGGVQPAALRVFTEAVAGVLERWVSEAESGMQHGSLSADAARQRVHDVGRRADELAASVQLTDALAGNRFLPSGFAARLRILATALSGKPAAKTAATADRALDAVRDHAIARLDRGRADAAEMAVRLLRWLAQPSIAIESVAAGVREQFEQWAWVDRALTTLWTGDVGADPVVAAAYRKVCEAVQARRETLDEAFAQRLVQWAKHASVTESGGCLLVEQVQERIALPLAHQRAPLIVVLDGMSGAVATELADQLAGRAFMEVGPQVGERSTAVAMIPSVTRASRASLLVSTAISGDQGAERAGFAAFWRKHHRDAALFHKGDIAGRAGQRLAEPLAAALAEDVVVGVVLNTIDDALDHGREGDRIGWRVRDITHLPDLLDAARDYGRPVVLVSDHGHVLDRGCSDGPVAAPGRESARWRTGTPEAGEVALAGPRVVYGDGEIVAPWRESIRYTQRKYGYHGGVSLAEMTVPILVLLPSTELLPAGWHVLPPEAVRPSWWQQRQEAAPVPAPAQKPGKARKTAEPEAVDTLFTVDTPAKTLGAQVVATEIYDIQRRMVPKAPSKEVVATVIDALSGADGVLSLTAVAEVAGRAARRPEFFAAALQRLLNVDSYPVLSLVDGDRRLKLDRENLRMQFGVRE